MIRLVYITTLYKILLKPTLTPQHLCQQPFTSRNIPLCLQHHRIEYGDESRSKIATDISEYFCVSLIHYISFLGQFGTEITSTYLRIYVYLNMHIIRGKIIFPFFIITNLIISIISRCEFIRDFVYHFLPKFLQRVCSERR